LALVRSGLRPLLGAAATVCLAVAYVTLTQGPGWEQNSHYALTRALADGTTIIDRTRYETGVWNPTGDISVYRGHTYSNKAPGFAFANLPGYEAMKAAGEAWPWTDDTGQLWFLGLWTVVLPAAGLLFLVRRVANTLEPGYGTLAAVTLGIGTLVLPFSTLFFSHLFSALLCFGSFTLLWLERRGPPRLGYVTAAGLVAGYAITTEFPNAIIAAILGLAALTRPERLWRALAFGSGALAGLVPLLVYNRAAFGSPFHLSYQSTVGFGPTNSLFLTTPSFRRVVDVLFAPVGVVRTTPVLVLVVIGVVSLYRRHHRFEAVVISGVVLAFLLFEASYVSPFGGASPGPRQLIPALPFVAVALASAYRLTPLTTITLATVSAVEMVAATITPPLYYSESAANWFHEIGAGNFSGTVVSFFGPAPLDRNAFIRLSGNWYDLLVFFVPLALAIVCAAAERRRLPLRRDDAVRAVAALLGWLIVQHEGPTLLYGGGFAASSAAPLVVLSLAAVVALGAIASPALLTLRRPST
jgi:hypothetical protein